VQFVYFTKELKSLDVKGLIAFAKEVGLDGLDLAVRPGYPIDPDNAATALPDAVKAFKDAGLIVGLVSAVTDLTDPESKTLRGLFDACGKADIPAMKIGYFSYNGGFDDALKEARTRMDGLVKLAEKTKVRVCCHTHSGNYLGNNAASMRMLLQDFDPHHVGAYVDTGHTVVNGGPIRLELDLVRPWLSLVAIKDMLYRKDDKKGWQSYVVPAGDGIQRWDDFAKGVKECKFNGTISLHGEYEAKDLDERKGLAKRELEFLKKQLM
jgi:sugar phosphate isomerase/epimerase